MLPSLPPPPPQLQQQQEQEQGLPVDGSIDADLVNIMETTSRALQKALPNDSFKVIFWEQ